MTNIDTAIYIANLQATNQQLLKILKEWLNTPFFETKEEWQEWVNDYRPRVIQVIVAIEGDNDEYDK